MACKSIITTSHSFLNAAGFFRQNARSEGAAEGGCGGNSAAPERSAERSEAGQCRFRFLDLCIIFGKMISKVCEGFNSGAYKKPPRCTSWWFFICSGGGIRTHDQRINSPLRYRCATPESIKLSIIFFFSRKPFGDLRKNSL